MLLSRPPCSRKGDSAFGPRCPRFAGGGGRHIEDGRINPQDRDLMAQAFCLDPCPCDHRKNSDAGFPLKHVPVAHPCHHVALFSPTILPHNCSSGVKLWVCRTIIWRLSACSAGCELDGWPRGPTTLVARLQHVGTGPTCEGSAIHASIASKGVCKGPQVFQASSTRSVERRPSGISRR